MIPDGIQVNPVNGQLDSQVNITVESYSGRLMHDPRELFCYTQDNTAEDSVIIWQEGKQEFISINEPLSHNVPAVGDIVTITGSSNSKEVSIKGGGDGFTYEFYVNGEKIENWDGRTIPGDVGAKEEFTWEIKVTVPENRSDNPRSWNIYFTNNEEINTGYVIINQAAGVRTYGDVVIDSFTYSPNPVSAAGGNTSPTVTYHQYWGWNGTTDDGGVITSGASMSYSGTGVSAATGTASVPSKGTVRSDETVYTTSTVTVTLNGKSASAQCDIRQQKNIIVSAGFEDFGNALSYPIAAAGATSVSPNPDNPDNYTRYYIYSSGERLNTNYAPDGYSVSYPSILYTLLSVQNGFTAVNASNGVLTCTHRGSTIGNARTSGVIRLDTTVTITPQFSYGNSITFHEIGEATCTQEKNVPVSISAIVGYSFSPNPVSAAGGTAAGQTSTYYDCTWTSGSVSNHHAYYTDPAGTTIVSNASQSTQQSSAGATIDLSGSGSVAWAANSGTSRSVIVRRTCTLTLTISSTYGGGTLNSTGYADATSTQNAVGVAKVDVIEDWTFSPVTLSAAGGTASLSREGYANVTLTNGSVIECRMDGNYTGFSIKFTRTYTPSLSSGFSYTVSNGIMNLTAASRGTVLGAARGCGTVTTTLSATVTPAYTGNALSDSATKTVVNPVTQALNTITAFTVDFRFSYPKTVLSSSGETVNRTLNDFGYNLTYSSGATSYERDTIANLSITSQSERYSMTASTGWSINTTTGAVTCSAQPQGSSVRYSGTISGTGSFTLKDGINGTTLSNSKTYTYGTLSQSSLDIVSTQLIITAGNAGTGWQDPSNWGSLPASTCYIGCYGTIRYTYSDGSTRDENVGWLYTSQGLSSDVSWATSWTNGGFQIASRGTTAGSARTGHMVWTSGGLTSNTLTFTQVANAIVSTEYQNCTMALTEINNNTTVPASGGLRQLKVSGAVQYRYLYTSGSYTGWTAKSIGFDDVTITGSATGFSRSGFNVNVASMGNVFQSSRSCTYTATYATCSSRLTLTQKANSMSTVWRLDWIKGTDITSYDITQPSGGDLYSNAYDTATIRGSGESRTYGVYRITTFASGVVEEGYCSLSNFSEKSVSAGDALLESTSGITGGNRAECDYAPYMAETATNNRSGVWYVTAEYSYNNATGVISHFIRLNVNVTQTFVLLQYQIIPTGTLSYTNGGNSPMLWFAMVLQIRGDTGTLGQIESGGFDIQPSVTSGTNNGVWETSYMKMGDSYFTVEKLILRLYGNNAGGTYNAQFSLSNLTVSYAGSTVTLSVSPMMITIPPITGGATYIDIPIYTWNNSIRFSLTSVPSDRIIRPSINGGPFTFSFF